MIGGIGQRGECEILIELLSAARNLGKLANIAEVRNSTTSQGYTSSEFQPLLEAVQPSHGRQHPRRRRRRGQVAPALPVRLQTEQLGAADTGHHHEPHQRAPVVVLGARRVDDPCRLRHRRRIGLRGQCAGLARDDGGVVGDPAPPRRRARRGWRSGCGGSSRPTAACRRAAGTRRPGSPSPHSHAAGSPAAGGRHGGRLCFTSRHSCNSLVRCSRNGRRSQRATAPQLGVEALQDLGGDPADREVSDRRVEVRAGVLLVTDSHRRLDVVRTQPLVHRRAERRTGLRVLLGVDLCAETRESLLGLRLGRDRLAEVEPALA
jgi:hypothetical protein